MIRKFLTAAALLLTLAVMSGRGACTRQQSYHHPMLVIGIRAAP
jgi:hypothetical protein